MEKWIFEQKHMDTRVTITAYSSREKDVVASDAKKAFAVFKKLENQFSVFRQDSELSRLNYRAGLPVRISPLLFAILRYTLKIAAKSGGVFSPLRSSKKTPLLAHIIFDQPSGTVTLPPETNLDLNSVVKGLAIDMALNCFENNENIMIEAGGDIKAKGLPPKTNHWDVGIRNPANPKKIITVIHPRDCAICTSGEYFRKAHLVNPLTKKSNIRGEKISSITVISPTAREADALSTAAYFMDIEDAVPFVEQYDSASCLIIDSANNIYAGPRMKPLFKA